MTLALAGCGDDDDDAADGAIADAAPADARADAALDSGVSLEPLPAGRADGTLGAWRQLAVMPTPRANHCAAVIGNTLLVVGGNWKPTPSGPFEQIDVVHAARIFADGTLGAWYQAGRLPSPAFSCTATATVSRLVVVDALYDEDADEGHVWTAELGTDGKLGAFTSAGMLPPGYRSLSQSAWMRGNELVAMSGKLEDDGDRVVTLRTPLSGASIGVWAVDEWHPGWRGRPQVAETAGYIYVMGGYLGPAGSNQVVKTVSGAVWSPFGGPVGTLFTTTDLPMPTAFGGGIGVDGYAFVLGGRDQLLGTAPRTTVYSGWLQAGRVSSWTETMPLPAPRANFALALAGNHLYLLGGGNDGPGEANTWVSLIRR